MKRIAWLLLLAPSLVAAQNPPDSGSAARRQRREAWVGQALGLTTDQAAKLEATRARFAPQRGAIRSLAISFRCPRVGAHRNTLIAENRAALSLISDLPSRILR